MSWQINSDLQNTHVCLRGRSPCSNIRLGNTSMLNQLGVKVQVVEVYPFDFFKVQQFFKFLNILT